MAESMRIVCGHCLTTNRVPSARLDEKPTCGKCKQAILTKQPVSVDQQGLNKMIAGNDVPVVVDFWAPWCGPCRSFAPVFEQAAASLEPHYRFVKVDTEATPQAGSAFAIRSIPTLVKFQGGREVKRQSGALPAPAFRQWLEG